LEKAERNILPVLNNLLENREMALEDGRFLVSAKRYDRLISEQNYTKQQLDELKVRRRMKIRMTGLFYKCLQPTLSW